MKAFRPERARLLHEVRATVRLALPLIAAQLAAIGSNVIDALLAGHVSAHVLGAVAVGAGIWSLAIVSGALRRPHHDGLERLPCEVGILGERVGLLHIAAMVPAMMDIQRLARDHRIERIGCVGKIFEFDRHDELHRVVTMTSG